MKTNGLKSILLLLAIPLLMSACREQLRVPKWFVLEIALEAENSYENPYMEVEISAEFTSPEGNTRTVRGFWDGGNSYKIRFTPDAEGKWTYRISNNQRDKGLESSGSLLAIPPDQGRNGFVRVDAEHPYHFVYDDGTRYYMCGTTYYNIVLSAHAGDKWKTAIDSALVFGINKFRFHALPEKNSTTPYPTVYAFEEKEGGLDHTRLNIEHFRKIDEVVQYADLAGMVADIMPFSTGRYGYSGDSLQDRHYLRYIIARYAAYPNIIWCLVNEWNYRQRRLGISKPYYNMMGETVRAEDPWMENGEYLRPLSIHQQTRIDFQFFNYDWPTHAIIQLGVRSGQGVVKDEWDIPAETQPLYRQGDQWGNAGIIYNLGHDMPVVNDEYGYMGEPRDRAASNSPNRDEWPQFTRERHRNVIWGIAVAGGYGTGGDKNSYEDGKPYFSSNFHSEPEEYRDIKRLVDFFTAGGIEYWKMYPRNEIILSGNRVYALAEPGKRYIFYAAAGGSFTAELEMGSYAVDMFNPATGETEDQGLIEGKLAEFELPEGDWVLHLVSRSEQGKAD